MKTEKCTCCNKLMDHESVVWSTPTGMLSTIDFDARPYCPGCCPEQKDYEN